MISYLPKDPTQVLAPKGSLHNTANDYSIVMNEKASRHHWSGVGPLSLKLILKGEAGYKIGNKKLTLDERRLLILNDNEKYTIDINSNIEVETFIVFFDRAMVEEVMTSFFSTSSMLLDSPDHKWNNYFMFATNTVETSLEIKNMALSWKSALNNQSTQVLREHLYFLLTKLVSLELGQRSKARSLDFSRKSTRDEIARRLLDARDYLHSSLSQKVTLGEISSNCALSKNHLLRTFKEYFGKTPFQYLTDIRIAKAKDLLINNPDIPVTEVCSQVGFESLSSFSWSFSRRTGMAPSEYRWKKVIQEK